MESQGFNTVHVLEDEAFLDCSCAAKWQGVGGLSGSQETKQKLAKDPFPSMLP